MVYIFFHSDTHPRLLSQTHQLPIFLYSNTHQSHSWCPKESHIFFLLKFDKQSKNTQCSLRGVITSLWTKNLCGNMIYFCNQFFGRSCRRYEIQHWVSHLCMLNIPAFCGCKKKGSGSGCPRPAAGGVTLICPSRSASSSSAVLCAPPLRCLFINYMKYYYNYYEIFIYYLLFTKIPLCLRIVWSDLFPL